MKHVIDFNSDWLFHTKWTDILKDSLKEAEIVNLPHNVKEVDLHYFDEDSSWFVSGYQRVLNWDKSFENKRILIHFEAAMSAAEIFVNGKSFGEHKGGYTPFTHDITDVLKKDSDNLIAVKLDSTERKDIPPFGANIDYLCYGGIYREVQIIVASDISIEKSMLTGLSDAKVCGKIIIRNSEKKKDVKENINIKIYDGSNVIHEHKEDIALSGQCFEEKDISFNVKENIKLWDIENPNLYKVEVSLSNKDSISHNIGFRTALFNVEGFFLNGNKINLCGLNRHQSYPFVGYAMPSRVQKRDADILKNDMALNLVRTSHYPQSRHFLDRCDEIGLLVIEEIPGWEHIGNKNWQDVSVNDVKDMVERDYHHPSIIMWGTRINESADNHDFYTRTNAMAKSLDNTRATGGTRCNINSELIEDVYVMNDFNHDGKLDPMRSQRAITGLDKLVPYMITEYNGHMFPTKMNDCEERQMEHTLRHYRIIDAVAKSDEVAGATGWCAFDYHTHYNFGSGDRFCYHGVADIFRNLKFAGTAYASQIDNKTKVYLEPISIFARGERSIGGVIPLVISTNCDYVDIYHGGKLLKREYPQSNRFMGLRYPPIVFEVFDDRLIGAQDWNVWDDIKLVGFIDEKVAIERQFAKNPLFSNLEVIADDDCLNAVKNGSAWDATRITIKAVDQCGNRLPYINLAVSIDIDGPAEIIGDTVFSLEGGLYSFWVKTINSIEEASNIKIRVKTKKFEEKIVNIRISK